MHGRTAPRRETQKRLRPSSRRLTAGPSALSAGRETAEPICEADGLEGKTAGIPPSIAFVPLIRFLVSSAMWLCAPRNSELGSSAGVNHHAASVKTKLDRGAGYFAAVAPENRAR